MMTPEGTDAHLKKEDVRTLRLRLETFRQSLAQCTIPSHRQWLIQTISDIGNALYERTGMRY